LNERQLPPRAPGESKRAYAKRLNLIPLLCLCGCAQPITVIHANCEAPPQYRHACYLRQPGHKAVVRRTLKRLWQDPGYRKAHQERAAHILDDPAVNARRRKAIDAYFDDPANRRKRFKFTLSLELIARYPAEREWIEAHALDLDGDLSIYPEGYLTGELLYSTVEYAEERPRLVTGDATDSHVGFAVAISDLYGNHAETLEACRL